MLSAKAKARRPRVDAAVQCSGIATVHVAKEASEILKFLNCYLLLVNSRTTRCRPRTTGGPRTTL